MGSKRLLVFIMLIVFSLAVPAAAQETVEVRRIPVPGLLFGAKLSPDGRTLAVFENLNVHDGSEVVDLYRPIRLIDIETGEARLLDDQTDYASDVAFSPDGTRLASYHGGGYISLWDVASGEEIKRIPATAGTSRLSYMPDGTTLAVALPGTMTTNALWDTETGAITAILTRRYSTFAEFQAAANPTGGGSSSLQFDFLSAFVPLPDGSAVIAATALDNVYRWDIASGQPQYLVVSESDRPNFNIRQITVTGDGQTLIYFHRTEQTIHFYDLATAAETSTLSANTHLDLAVSPDGQKIVWIDADTGNLMVWNAGSPDAPTAVSVPELEPVHESLRPPMGGLLLTPAGDQGIISGFTALDSGENEIWVVPLPG